MKFRSLATLGAILLAPAVALAQSGTNIPPGQSNPLNGIDPTGFPANTQSQGFTSTTLGTVVAAGTTQATATLLQADTNVITACTAGQGVLLPAVLRPQTISVRNRGAVACLVYPTVGSQIEANAVNAPASVAPGGVSTFLPVSATQWYTGASPSTVYAIRTILAGADTATTGDYSIVWRKTTGSASAEAIPGCVAALKGNSLQIIDGKGDAATNNITITPASGTVANGATLVISANLGTARIQCDGVSDWVKN